MDESMDHRKKEMLRGWDYACEMFGSLGSAQEGEAYIEAIAESIELFEKSINEHQYRNLGINQLQGYVFEEYAAGTFNINAAVKRSFDRAEVPHSNDYGSIDILLRTGREYSAKSYKDGEKSAVAQVILNPETREAKYKGMDRLIPKDQIDDAVAKANREMLRNLKTRPETSEAYRETAEKLTALVENQEGIHSRGVSREELNQIAGEAKEQRFSAEEHGIKLNSEVEYQDILDGALEVGIDTALYVFLIEMIPEFLSVLSDLIQNGQLSGRDLLNFAEKGVETSASGFAQGMLSYFLKASADAGKLGEAFLNLSSETVAGLITMSILAIKNTIKCAFGKMSRGEMAESMLQAAIIIFASQAVGKKFGNIGKIIGLLIGSMVCAVFGLGKQRFLSLCVENGFVFFGLVDQNYELPEEYLRECGIEFGQIEEAFLEEAQLEEAQIEEAVLEEGQPDVIRMVMVKRGVIGFNQIGFQTSEL